MNRLVFFIAVMLVVTHVWGQTNVQGQKTVSGKVTDDSGEGIPGVTIQIQGTLIGAISDIEGNYSVEVPEGATLIFSSVGYLQQEILVGNRTVIDVNLEPDITQLEEVVLIGYGKLKAEDATGSVQLIDSDDFNKGITNSPGQLLQGKLAGVNVTSGTGEPGSAVDINIRGVNSIGSSSNPLYVINGVPVDGGSGAGIAGFNGTRPKSPLNFLNPSDIESITVLKDASATAIYGTRGANGVILIETKKGKTTGGPTLTYDTYFSTSSVAKKIDVLSAAEYRTETARLAPLIGRDPADYIDTANANTDWQDELFRTAFTQNHNLSFRGGSEKATFNASIGYLNQEGLIKTTGHNKITGHLNIGTSVLDDNIKFQFNVTAAKTEDESQATGGSAGATGNLLSAVIRANPTAAPFDSNGELNGKAGATDNPLSILNSFRDFSETKTLLTNLTTTVSLTKNLNYKLNLAHESNDIDRSARTFPNTDIGGEIVQGRVSRNTVETSNFLVENYLSYNKSFNEFNVDAILGHSYQSFENKGAFVTRDDFTTTEIDPINNIGVGTTTIDIGSFINTRKLQSFFARIQTNYLDKYLFTASIRADGSSVFGENNRYGRFPSAALGWKISEEDFLKDSDIFSNLKLRLGWGETGNQAVPPKVTQGSFAVDNANGFVFDGTAVINGVTVARTANPDLKWEVTEQTNIGLDWGLFNGKINGSIDYFQKSTTDLFLKVAAPSPSVVAEVFVNSDTEIINKGSEFVLNAYVIDTDAFRLDFGGNITFIDNTIRNLATDILVGNVSGPGATGETSGIYRTGYSAGSFFLNRFEGFDEEGFEVHSDEKEILGDALPDATYGFNVNSSYKRFDLSLSFNGVSGVDIFNNTARAYSSAAALAQNGDNLNTNYLEPKENPTRAIITSSRYLESGDFLRLNNATLGFNKNVDNIDWLNSFRLYITGQNLFVITDYSGYDPEVNTQGGNVYGVDYAAYPKARTFLVGLNISIN